MQRSVLFVLPMLGLAGCATGPSLQSRMAAYIGDSSQTLVQSLGVPDKHITVSGVQYLAYSVRHEAQFQPNDIGFIPFHGPFYGDGFYGAGFYDFPQPIQEWYCEATFMLKNDRVFNFVLRGNDCG